MRQPTTRAARRQVTMDKWWATLARLGPVEVIESAKVDPEREALLAKLVGWYWRDDENLKRELDEVAAFHRDRYRALLAEHESADAADRARNRRLLAAALDGLCQFNPQAADILRRRADRPTVIDHLRQRQAGERPPAA